MSIEIFNNGEENWHESGRENGRQIVAGCVDPSKEEVVVSVREAFSGEVELLCSSFIEFSSRLRAEWHVRHMEIGILSPLGPL